VAVNPATGGLLAGVQVTLSGAASASVITGADGSFAFTRLAAGSYTIALDKGGFTPVSRALTIGLGQRVDLGTVNLAAVPTVGIIKGRVTAVANGQPIAGVTVSVSGSLAASRTSDAQGLYEFAVVPPGTVTLSASRSGYVSVGGTASIAAGETLTFSPALAANNEPPQPSTGRLMGRIVAAGTGAPLSGVILQLNGASAGTSSAMGDFDLTLAAGSYSLRIALPGYDVVTGSFVITAATNTQVGDILLSPQRQNTAISGRVTSAETGQPVAGARVEVVNGISTTSAADGSYLLDGLTGMTFNLRASATGFLTQSWQLQTSRSNAIAQDFALTPNATTSADLSNLQLSPASVGPSENVVLTATLTNTGSGPEDVIVRSQVVDSAGNVVATGGAFAADGLTPLGSVTLGAGASRPVVLKWNSGLFAPGSYQLQGLVVQAGTVSQLAPNGRTLSTQSAALSILAKEKYIGATAAKPAVMRAGLGVSTTLTALVQNGGNVELPARSYRLDVIDEKTGVTATQLTVAGPRLPLGELQTLSFGAWVPGTAGNYRLVMSAPSAPELGQLLGKLYVGDVATAVYSVDKPIVGAGNQSVRGKLTISGQDIAAGSVSDPLAVPIRAAIQRSVAYNDLKASDWVKTNQCLGCHVVSQALVGGELTRKITTPNEKQRTALFNALSTYRQSNGTVYASHPETQKVQTTLSAWAMNSWHARDEFAAALTAVADSIASAQQPDGKWSPDYTDVYMWRSPIFSTAFNIKSLAEVVDVLGRVPNPVAFDSAAWKSDTSMSGNYTLIADPATGGVIVSNYNTGTVQAFASDGTAQTLMSGLTGPQGLVLAADGTLYVATTPGILQRMPNGTVSTYAAIPNGAGLAMAPNGDLFVTFYNTPSIKRVTPGGNVSDFYSGAPLDKTAGLQVDADGSLIVLSYEGHAVHRLRADGTYETLTSAINGNPRNIQRWRDGWLIGTSTGVYYYNARWEGDRLGFNMSLGIAAMADGSIVTSDGWGTLSRLTPRTVNGPVRAAAYTSAVSRAADWLLNDSIHNDWLYTLQIAHRLIGLANAKKLLPVGTPQAAAIQAKMNDCEVWLRSRQNADGGWGQYPYPNVVSDSLVTAQVGFALDYMHPSPSDPVIQKAIQFLLSKQQADGSWLSENQIFRDTRLAPTTWVEIWLPVALDRIAGIDTDVSLKFASDVTLSNPSIAPTTTTLNGDGSTSYLWKMVGVTAANRELQFDLALLNLQIGESRPASVEASMTFRNSEGGVPVVAPIAIPAVSASGFLGFGVSTDKSVYASGAAVGITGQVNNLGTSATTAAVELRVLASDGYMVADLGRVGVAQMTGGGSGMATASWNAGAAYAGSYFVEAKLFDAADRYVATAKTNFTVQAGGDPAAPTLGAALQLDKGSYNPGDSLRLVDRVTNLANNQAWQGLMLQTTVHNPDGSMRWTATAVLDELSASSVREQSYVVPLSNAPAGSYEARVKVLDTNGNLRAEATKSFRVSSTANTGVGLTGHIGVSPKPVFQGSSVSFAFDVANHGNASLASLPLRVDVVAPGSQQVLASMPYAVALNSGGSYAGNATWGVNAAAGTTLVAVLNAQIGGRDLMLAQEAFSVAEAPALLTVDNRRQADTRLLVLVTCPWGIDPTTCMPKRLAALQSMLDSLGLPYKIVTTKTDFENEFRCGRYNAYWISGGSRNLDDVLVKELREAVRRGEALLLDGAQFQRDALLHPVTGVLAEGSLPSGVLAPGMLPLPTSPGALVPITVDQDSQSPFAPGVVSVIGPVHRFALISALPAARFADGKPAIAFNRFGSGNAWILSFDLTETLIRSATNMGTMEWLRNGLSGIMTRIASNPSVFTLGDVGALSAQVSNQGGQPVAVEWRAHLPAGTLLVDSSWTPTLIEQPTAQAAGQAVWRSNIAGSGAATLFARISVEKAGVPLDVSVSVYSVAESGIATLLDAKTHPFEASTAEALSTSALAAAQSLAPSSTADVQARDRAIAAIDQARSLQLNGGDPTAAMPRWIAAADELRTMTSLSSTALAEAQLAVALGAESAADVVCPLLRTLQTCFSGALNFSSHTVPLGTSPSWSFVVLSSCTSAFDVVAYQARLLSRFMGSGRQHLSNGQTSPSFAPGSSIQVNDTFRSPYGFRVGEYVDAELELTWKGIKLPLAREVILITPSP
jgi:hypothetical protein